MNPNPLSVRRATLPVIGTAVRVNNLQIPASSRKFDRSPLRASFAYSTLASLLKKGKGERVNCQENSERAIKGKNYDHCRSWRGSCRTYGCSNDSGDGSGGADSSR